MITVLLGLVFIGSVRRRFVDDLGTADVPIPFTLREHDEPWWSA